MTVKFVYPDFVQWIDRLIEMYVTGYSIDNVGAAKSVISLDGKVIAEFDHDAREGWIAMDAEEV